MGKTTTVVTLGGLLAQQGKRVLLSCHRQSELFGIVTEIAGDQAVVKNIMSGEYRGVGRKYSGAGNLFDGTAVVQPRCHQLPATLQHLEGRVTFIDVPDCRFKTQGAQGAYATDAQYHFLLDARIDIAAIQLVGQYTYGMLPPKLFKQIKNRLLKLIEEQGVSSVKRTDM